MQGNSQRAQLLSHSVGVRLADVANAEEGQTLKQRIIRPIATFAHRHTEAT